MKRRAVPLSILLLAVQCAAPGRPDEDGAAGPPSPTATEAARGHLRGEVHAETLLDASRAPLAGARVDLFRCAAGERVWLGATDSDARGRYAFPDELVEAATADVERPTLLVMARAEGHESRTSVARRSRVDPEAWLGTRIALPPGPCLTGRVVDASGAPVPGAEVELAFRQDEAEWDELLDTEPTCSDDEGRFRLPLGVESQYLTRRAVVVTRAPDDRLGSLALGRLDRLDDLELGTIALAPPALLECRLVTRSGRPVPFCLVEAVHAGLVAAEDAEPLSRDAAAESEAVGWFLRRPGSSDARGIARFERLAPGDYRLFAREPVSPLGRSLGRTPVPASGPVRDVVVDLPRLAARLVDADGTPCPDAALVVVPLDHRGPPPFVVFPDEDGVARCALHPRVAHRLVAFHGDRMSWREPVELLPDVDVRELTLTISVRMRRGDSDFLNRDAELLQRVARARAAREEAR